MIKAWVKHFVLGDENLSLVALPVGTKGLHLLVTVPHQGAEIFRGEPEKGKGWLPCAPGEKDMFSEIEVGDETVCTITDILVSNTKAPCQGMLALFRNQVARHCDQQQANLRATLTQIQQYDL